MKKISIIAVLLLLVQMAIGQINFSYDNTGNRILRSAIIGPTYSLTISSQTGLTNVAAAGGNNVGNFVVASTNVNWNISGVPSWATVSSSSGGNGSTTINVSFAANGGTASRSANLTISGDNGVSNQSVTISQVGTGGVGCVVNKVKLAYRGGSLNNGCCFDRLIGSKIQGSNNNSTWTDLYTFNSPGNGNLQEFTFSNTTSYTYVRFQGGANSFGELTQLEFYNSNTILTGTGFGTENYANALDSDPNSGWHGSNSGPQNVAGLQLTGCTGGCTNPPSAPSITSNATTAPATLTASGCSGTITWNDNATGTTKNVSVAGTYSATCTTTGCPVSAAGSITINAPTGSSKCPYQDAQGWHYWSYAENRFKDGNFFAWDAANSRILYALSGSQGLYASLSPNPGGQVLTIQQLRDAGVTEEIVACFNGGGCSCTSPTPSITASPASGVPTTLTASGCSGTVTWGDGTTGTTKSVSSTGTYTATCTNSGCCISAAGSITISSTGGGCVVNKVKLAYRGGEHNNGCCFERLIGSKIQGSNNNSTWTDLYTFSSAGNGTLQEFTFANTTSYSYVRFQAGANSWGELSQLEFYNNANRLNGTGFGTESFARALDNDPYTGWHASASPGPQNVAGLQLTGCTGGCTNPPSAPSITSNATTAPATLTANGCSGTITWNDNATGTTKSVSVAGTYSATCTTTGCPVSAAGSITINAPTGSSKCPYQDAQGWHYWSYAENRFKDGNYFAWDAANSRILYALSGSQGLYASLSPNPGGVVLTLQQLRDAGVTEEIVACFNGGGCTNPPPAPSITSNATTAPATLTASGCSGTITWNDNTTGTTKNVSVAGTYSATCTTTGCPVSAAGSITISTPTSSKCPYQDAQGWHYWSFAENKFKDGNYFAWDAANSRILYALNGSQGLYASLSPNPGGQVLNRQQLRDAGVSEEIIPCFSNGQSRIGVVSNEKDVTTTVYPNPTEGKITIDFYLESEESVWLNFYNSEGRNMDIKNIQANKGYNSFELDIRTYPAGAYFVNLQSSQKREILKVMKVN